MKLGKIERSSADAEKFPLPMITVEEPRASSYDTKFSLEARELIRINRQEPRTVLSG
jgi:hypothetical protein